MEDEKASSAHISSQGTVSSDSPSSAQSQNNAAPSFLCKMDDSTTLISMLTTIYLEKDQVPTTMHVCTSPRVLLGVFTLLAPSLLLEQKALCTATSGGMKFIVEKAKSLQAKAYLKAELFQEFKLTDQAVTFTVNLGTLLDCLQVFGEASHLEISYAGYGQPLCLL